MKLIRTFSDFISEQMVTTSAPVKAAPKKVIAAPVKKEPVVVAPTAEAITKEKAALTAKLDAGFKKLQDWLIAMFVDGNAFWTKYKSAWGDNESTAWKGLEAQWDLDCAPTLTDLTATITQLTKDVAVNGKYANDADMVTLSKKMNLNLTEVSEWMTGRADDSLHDTFEGANDSDTFAWTLNFSTGPVSKSIDADF